MKLFRLITIISVAASELVRAAPAYAGAAWRRDPSRRHAVTGAWVRASLLRLGPCFVKLGQMLSCRVDLLPAPICSALAELQSGVRYGDSKDVAEAYRFAASELPQISIDPTPIGLGSIACVFRGTLPSGITVAVKVVRPHAATLLHTDVALLRSALTWIERLSAHTIHARTALEPICVALESQLDMETESRALIELSRSVEGGIRIVQPRTEFAGHSRLIVMELLERHTPFGPLLGIEPFRAAAAPLLKSLYRMIFVQGLIHCDLHPGNVLVAQDGTVVLVDAGLASRLPLQEREIFLEFFSGLATRDATLLADSILRSSPLRPRSFAESAFRSEVAGLVERFHGLRAGEFLVAELVLAVFALQRRHGLGCAPGFASAIWALSMFEGLVRARFPEIDFQALSRPYVVSSLISRAAIKGRRDYTNPLNYV